MKKIRLNRKNTISIFLFIIVTIIFLGSKLPIQSKEWKIKKIPVENCNTQKQTCIVNLDELKIGISLDKNIYYLKKFDVSIWTEVKKNYDIDSIYIDFKMNNMNMGVNRFMLLKVNSENNKQQWQGTALLPICVTGRADWFSELEVVTKQTKYILTFPLNVKRSNN